MENPGATHNFVIHAFAKGLSLPSRLLALSIKVLGNKMINQDTMEYSLILKDMHGIRHSATAVALGSISKVKRAPNNNLLMHTILNSSKHIQRAFNTTHSSVDIMLGIESRSLHCRDRYKVGNIRLNRSVFAEERKGCRWQEGGGADHKETSPKPSTTQTMAAPLRCVTGVHYIMNMTRRAVVATHQSQLLCHPLNASVHPRHRHSLSIHPNLCRPPAGISESLRHAHLVSQRSWCLPL